MLTATNTGAGTELDSVGGIGCSIIADKACETSGIIVSCEGPLTRIYCLFDDDAIDRSDANEDVLGFDPLNADWSISLPCHSDDLSRVQSALKEKTDRNTARDQNEKRPASDSSGQSSPELETDVEGILGS